MRHEALGVAGGGRLGGERAPGTTKYTCLRSPGEIGYERLVEAKAGPRYHLPDSALGAAPAPGAFSCAPSAGFIRLAHRQRGEAGVKQEG